MNITEVVCLVVPHESGGLYKALQILSKNNVPVDYMYAFALENKASVIIRSSSNDMIIKVLQEHKIELLKASDIYSI